MLGARDWENIGSLELSVVLGEVTKSGRVTTNGNSGLRGWRSIMTTFFQLIWARTTVGGFGEIAIQGVSTAPATVLFISFQPLLGRASFTVQQYLPAREATVSL